MHVRIVTPPTQEPVTLAEAKEHLRLEESRDDSYVQTLITAARQYVEKVSRRAVLVQSLELQLAGFRGDDKLDLTPSYVAATPQPYPSSTNRFQPFIELIGGHLAETPSVVVTYLDTSGAQQTLSSSAYVVEGAQFDSRLGRIWLNTTGGYSWPDVLSRFDAVRVAYNVGWQTPQNVPAPIKQAVLLLISQLYEFRTPTITGTIATNIEFTLDALLSPYRLTRL